MLSRPVAFGLLAAACIVAAAGGSYLATRHYQPVPSSQQVALPASTTLPAPGPQATMPAGEAASGGQATPDQAATTTTPAGAWTEAPRATTPAAPVTARAADAEGAGSQTATEPRVQRSPARRATPPRASRGDRAAASGADPDTSRAEPPRGWPSPPAPVEVAGAAPQTAEPPVPPVPAPPVAPPQREFEELVVPAESVIGLQLQTPVSSERSRVEDPVEARVTREVKAGDRVAIPAGSRVLGTVTLVERGGTMRDQARIAIRFNTLVLADGTRTPINTETVYREGKPPGNESAAKIGGAAVGGAILGAIIGGRKGAAIGGAVGAGGGTAAVMAGDRSEVVLPAGTAMTIRVQAPITVTVEK